MGWLSRGQDIRVINQCRLLYGIKPFKDEVVCDVSPLEVCDVILGQPYMWKRHAIYESQPIVSFLLWEVSFIGYQR
jgi:hypothetical protein